MSKKDVDQIKDALSKQQSSFGNEVKKGDWLSSGSTLVNLACSGTPNGAYAKGKFFWMVGESSSGKTSLSLMALAEAAMNPNFDDYDLIFNNAEDGALMNIEKFYGKRLASRIKAPEYRDGVPHHSRSIDELYFHLDDRLTAVEKGKAPPFVEVQDSMDALVSMQDTDSLRKRKAAAESNKKATGDYGDGKAKYNSRYLRDVVARLSDTGSILIILSQERDNIGAGMFDPQNTVAGGRALKFYATFQLWSSVGASIKREVNGTDRKIGAVTHVSVKKNRLTGKEWSVDVPIYFSYGVDDLGSMVNFLVKEKFFRTKEKGSRLVVPDFSFEGSKEELIQYIDKNDLRTDLVSMTVEAWREIEHGCVVERKPRYV